MKLRGALLLLALCLAPAARAGEMDIHPVLVALSKDEKSAVVTVRNRSKEVARYQVTVFAWDQAPSGEMKLAPTADVAVFPRTLSIPPGEAKIVRVGTQVPFGAVEKSYRVFVEEMPPPPKPESASRVQVLSRIGIPIFLSPDQAIEKAVWGELRVEGGKVEASLRNLGNVRVRPAAVRLVAADAAGKPLHEKALDAWYVLPGGERRYAAQLPADVCGRVRSVAVEAQLPKEILRGSAETPQGTCAR